MYAYRKTHRSSKDHAAQSVVIHSGPKGDCIHRYSVHLLRSKHLSPYGCERCRERHGLTLFVSFPKLRFEVGTR
jgi:hypothetical protein